MEARKDLSEPPPARAGWNPRRVVPSWRLGAPWLVFIACLLGTWRAWDLARDQAHDRAAELFRAQVERIRNDIHTWMLAYDQVLKGAAGLYAASSSVERDEWSAYVLALGIQAHYPGIHGLGFIEDVPHTNRAAFLEDAQKGFRRSEGPATFTITPVGDREDYFVVKYIEPSRRNEPAFGFDIGTESVGRQAAEQARDVGDAILTGRLRLVQSGTDTPGVLLLRPIYRNGQLTNELTQRRAAIQGWVFGAFQMNELMANVLRKDRSYLDFAIYDEASTTTSEPLLLYDHSYVQPAGAEDPEGVFATNSVLSFARRDWKLLFRAQPQFGTRDPWNKPKFVLIAGLCMSLLVFGITQALASTQARAQALARDITRTLQVQERALSSSSNSITILDATQPGLSIIFANPAVERMTGYAAEELVGQDGSILLGSERDQPGVLALREAVSNGTECRTVLHCYRKDGTAFWNEINLSPVKSRSGIVTHFVSVSTDITGRLETERHLQEARLAAESTSRAKSEFLANMSHEIRTPLNAVIGLTELVLDTPLNEEQSRFLTAAHQSANELAALVNDVLDFSRIEAGKLELHPEAFRLRPLLESCLAAFSPRAQEKGLALNLRLGERLPDTLVADVLRLRQVLVNLISNAVKFTARGEVTLAVRAAGLPAPAFSPNASPLDQAEQTLLPLPIAAPREYPNLKPGASLELEFSVSDTGIGIPPGKHQAIFESFTQADNSITRRYGGTGLGLAISKRLVALLGGRLWVESEEGRGSTFHFTARVGLADGSPLPDVARVPTAPPVRTRRPLRVLVVEDNPVNAQLATAFLAKLGHTVALAANGHEAVTTAIRGEADLILMDVQMPGLDGLQATARIREHERGHGGHVPIIALTAHALPTDRAQCLAGGMDEYLAKPVRRADLFAAMERLLPGSAPPPATATPPPAADDSPLRQRLRNELGGDARALDRLIDLFLQTTPALLAELSTAAAARDIPRLARAAHTLKGSVMQMGGERARAAALAVEQAANAGQTEAALAALPALEREARRLTDELRSA